MPSLREGPRHHHHGLPEVAAATFWYTAKVLFNGNSQFSGGYREDKNK